MLRSGLCGAGSPNYYEDWSLFRDRCRCALDVSEFFLPLVSSTVSKIQLFCLSLVGALPAAYLSYLLGMYLISQPSGASSLVMIISIITLICTATIAVIPVLVMVLYHSNYDPPKPAKADKSKGKDKDKDDAADDEDSISTKADDEADPLDDLDGSASGELLADDDGELVDDEEDA